MTFISWSNIKAWVFTDPLPKWKIKEMGHYYNKQ